MEHWKTKDIILHNPHTLDEIVLKAGSEDHIKWLSHPLNQGLLKMGEEREALYGHEHKQIAEVIRKTLVDLGYKKTMPVMYLPDGKDLILTIFNETEPGLKFKITISLPEEKKENIPFEDDFKDKNLHDEFYDGIDEK